MAPTPTINQTIVLRAMQKMALTGKLAVVQFATSRKIRQAKIGKNEAHPKYEKLVLTAMRKMAPTKQRAVAEFAIRVPKKRQPEGQKPKRAKGKWLPRPSVKAQPPPTNRPPVGVDAQSVQPDGTQDTPNATPRMVPGVRQPPAAPTSLEIPARAFAFVLLPPGTWDVGHVVDHYRRLANHSTTGWAGRQIQWARIHLLNSLRPSRWSVGEDGWLGYVIFEFSWSRRVVLECPIEGNAAYVLRGDWKNMVGHTKQYLRTNFSPYCTKIVHKGEWLAHIKTALRD